MIMMKWLLSAAFMAAFSYQAYGQGKAYSNVTTPSVPTPGTFASVLSKNDNRTSCTITNVGTTQGFCQFKPPGFTPTTSNSIPVAANGGQFYCSSVSVNLVLQDEVDCTCASGTCAFVVNSTGQ